MASRLWRWCQLVLILLARGAAASSRNLTMDDTDDSIQYSANWRTDCPTHKYECPDPSHVHNGTLHWVWPYASVGGSADNITIRFAGTAVYVYNVLANFPTDLSLTEASVASIAFTLDGSPVGSYEDSGDRGQSVYSYHRLVYANASLSNGKHELVIVSGQSLVMFDYINYTSSNTPPAILPSSSPRSPSPLSSLTSLGLSTTFTVTTPLLHTVTTMVTSLETFMTTTTNTDTPTPTPMASSKEGSNRSTGAIVGGVVGSVLALLLLAMITLFVRRRLSSRRNGKGMGRLLDGDPTPHTNDIDHSTSNRSQFLRPAFPVLRPGPDVPRSPGHTMSSLPTSPTSYGGEAPSRMYMYDGTVARILEKADRARMKWPSSAGTKSIPVEFGFQWHDGSSGNKVSQERGDYR